MARSLGTLTVDLIADIGGWTDGLTKAEREADKKAKGIASAVGKVGTALGALGVVLSVDAFAGWIGGAIEFAGAAQDAADASGVLRSEWLALSGAAKVFAPASVDVQKALVELSGKILDNDAALSKLGVTTRDAAGNVRGTYDVFLDLADRFKDMKAGADETAAAVEIFGKRIGPDLLPLLNEGRAGIEETAAVFQNVSDKLVQQEGEWAKNTAMLGGVFDSIRASIAEALLPRLNDLTEWFVQFLPKLKPVGDLLYWLSGIITGPLTLAVKGALSLLSGFVGVVTALGQSLAAVVGAIVKTLQGDFSGAWEVLKAGGNDVLKTINDTGEQLRALWAEDAEAAKESARAVSEALAPDEERLGKFAESLKSLQQKEADVYAARLADAKYYAEQRGLSDAETNALIEAEYAAHLQRLADIDAKGKPKAKAAKPDESDPVAAGLITIQPLDDALAEQAAKLDEFRAMQAAADQLVADQKRARMAEELAAEIENGQLEIESAQIVADAKQAINDRAYDGAKGFLSNLSTLMNGESKKAFQLGKTAAIAQALIKTYEAANSAYAAMAGIPVVGPALGIAAAAAAVAAGMVNVNAIRSQQFGGGGGSRPSVPATVAASAAGTPYSPTVSGGQPESGRNVYVHGIDPGALFSGQQLLDLLNDAMRDGGTLRAGYV